MNFLREPKCRNVFRMAGLYLVGAWLISQAADTILPMFGAPEWVARTIVILLAIGFVPASILSSGFIRPDANQHANDLANDHRQCTDHA